MWRITQYIPRFSHTWTSCARSQNANTEETQILCSTVLDQHQPQRFICTSSEDERRKRREERQRKKEQEPEADREWFRQHCGRRHALDAFGLGSAVVLGVQFGHLCHLYMQRRDRYCCPTTPHSLPADTIQHPLCLYRLAEAMPARSNQNLLMKSILPAPAERTSSTHAPGISTLEKQETESVSAVSKRSLLVDLLWPYEEVKTSSIIQEGSCEEETSNFPLSTSSSSSLPPSSPSSSTNTPSTPPPNSASPSTNVDFSEVWTSLTQQYLGIEGNLEARRMEASGDEVGAFQLWRRTADETRYSKACFNTALCYETGRGTQRDEQKAAEYYWLASGLQNPTTSPHHAASLYNLALLYRNQPELMSTQPSSLPPRQLLERAAEAGMIEAMRALGVLLLQEEEEMEQGMNWLHKAALEHEDAESQFFLGECYKEGLDCLPQDLDAALEYYEMARRNGCQQAEEHITALKEQINKLEFDSLVANLGARPSLPRLSQSSPTLSQTLSQAMPQHLFHFSGWDSGFSSPTDNDMEQWGIATGGDHDNKVAQMENSTEKSARKVRFMLGEETVSATKKTNDVNKQVKKSRKTDGGAKTDVNMDKMFGGILIGGSFGELPFTAEKQVVK